MLLPGLLAFCVYGLGVPLYLVWIYTHAQLGSVRTLHRYGFLFKSYRREVPWWELTVLLRKAALVVIVRSHTSSPLLQAAYTLLALFAALIMQTYFEPYRYGRHDRFAAFCLAVNSFVSFSAMLQLSTDVSVGLLAALEWTVFAGIVSGFVFMVVLGMQDVAQHVRRTMLLGRYKRDAVISQTTVAFEVIAGKYGGDRINVASVNVLGEYVRFEANSSEESAALPHVRAWNVSTWAAFMRDVDDWQKQMDPDEREALEANTQNAVRIFGASTLARFASYLATEAGATNPLDLASSVDRYEREMEAQAKALTVSCAELASVMRTKRLTTGKSSRKLPDAP